MKYFLITEYSRNTNDGTPVGLVINVQDAVSFIQAVNESCGEMHTMDVSSPTGRQHTKFWFEHKQCNYYTVELVRVINNVTNTKVYY